MYSKAMRKDSSDSDSSSSDNETRKSRDPKAKPPAQPNQIKNKAS